MKWLIYEGARPSVQGKNCLFSDHIERTLCEINSRKIHALGFQNCVLEIGTVSNGGRLHFYDAEIRIY